MPSFQRMAVRWLTLAAVMTAVCGILHYTTQQIWRQMANDPQLQMARDAADALTDRRSIESVVPATQVDFARSLAPFVMILNDEGVVLASSGTLHGQVRGIPTGVLSHVREHGEERVTWQPEPGVRVATVVTRAAAAPARFVVAGRSLRETEERIDKFRALIGLGWVLSLAGLGVAVAVLESIT